MRYVEDSSGSSFDVDLEQVRHLVEGVAESSYPSQGPGILQLAKAGAK